MLFLLDMNIVVDYPLFFLTICISVLKCLIDIDLRSRVIKSVSDLTMVSPVKVVEIKIYRLILKWRVIIIYLIYILPNVTLITKLIKSILPGNCEIISVISITATDITMTSQILWIWHESICSTFKKLTRSTTEKELEIIDFKHGDLDLNSKIKPKT